LPPRSTYINVPVGNKSFGGCRAANFKTYGRIFTAFRRSCFLLVVNPSDLPSQ
jgi:hypothetical protein